MSAKLPWSIVAVLALALIWQQTRARQISERIVEAESALAALQTGIDDWEPPSTAPVLPPLVGQEAAEDGGPLDGAAVAAREAEAHVALAAFVTERGIPEADGEVIDELLADFFANRGALWEEVDAGALSEDDARAEVLVHRDEIVVEVTMLLGDADTTALRKTLKPYLRPPGDDGGH